MNDKASSNRHISPGKKREDGRLDGLMRPQQLAEFTGQERLKANLSILIEAAKGRQEPLDHVLFHGPPGLGKTTLAHVVANEMNVNIRITAGPAIERAGDLAAILTNMRAGDILFIDEVHRLGRAVEEILYPAMEDFVLDIVVGKGPGAKNVRLKLPKFTVIGATTRLALLTAPLRARFGALYRMDFYEQAAIESIVTRGASILQVPIEPTGAAEIARRSRGTPRVALRLLRRVRDFAEVRAEGEITGETAVAALNLLEIDRLGLDDLDRRVLRAIIEKFSGGPVGLDTIGASISEESDTIMDVVEPYLLQLGFLERTARGRVATPHAYRHLDLPLPQHVLAGKPNQPSLFNSPDSDAVEE
ncbi:MAG: Holliday junction branch migration DNA helicase RuvB [Ardenticatenaceae bacterium]|nr:Holliday junction branch migration DNA helicase RuvB [Anaerolineales bacterium]MCB8981363.1 Holliday junction branch migration DNA helicase RuvB [Ardenticatenaceae bacterium]